MSSPTPAASRARRLAGIVCFGEAAVVGAFGVGSLVALALGGGSDPMRVFTEALLVLLFAAGIGLLGWLWLGKSQWPAVPTVVWHVLLVPVAVSLFQSGQFLLGVLLALAIVTAVAATVAARPGQG